jgi:hypothetical protein
MNDYPDHEFDERVQSHIKLFDEVLARLGRDEIFRNSDFELGNESCGTFQAVFDVHSTTKSNAVDMWLHFTADGIRLDLDGINELFEWSADEISCSPQKVSEFLTQIFTGYILIEGQAGKRFVEIFDRNGHLFEWTSYNDFWHMVSGVHIVRHKTSRRLFLPFYA